MGPLTYIKNELSIVGQSFTKEWQTLTEQDKADLKLWAHEEMEALGMPRDRTGLRD